MWWCNTHEREATARNARDEPCCDPRLGGIMLPCRVVDLTGMVEMDAAAKSALETSILRDEY